MRCSLTFKNLAPVGLNSLVLTDCLPTAVDRALLATTPPPPKTHSDQSLSNIKSYTDERSNTSLASLSVLRLEKTPCRRGSNCSRTSVELRSPASFPDSSATTSPGSACHETPLRNLAPPKPFFLRSSVSTAAFFSAKTAKCSSSLRRHKTSVTTNRTARGATSPNAPRRVVSFGSTTCNVCPSTGSAHTSGAGLYCCGKNNRDACFNTSPVLGKVSKNSERSDVGRAGVVAAPMETSHTESFPGEEP
mmetsp:Transcript_3792/g.14033  ORF Transcript_3792/g.14033 Transcript_3792/m.14033 type:complete len:248 (-) Transcript_3792:904-1647(-)